MPVAETMRAMVLEKPNHPLRLTMFAVPVPRPDQVLVRVNACGICRTDLHIVDGELPRPMLPLIPGHEIVGRVVQRGEKVRGFQEGDRIGVSWLGSACGRCSYCRRGKDNLCDYPVFTGYTTHGGFAEYAVADAGYCFRLTEYGSDLEIAPFMCAGLIGYRSYRMIGNDAKTLGLYGFGAAAHILVQVARFQGKDVYSFTKPGDTKGQRFARELGSVWAGGSDEQPPEKLDAAIIFAPVGLLIPGALAAVAKGGTVICAGIHMSDIPSFPYKLLWEERTLRSVANLSHRDGEEFLALATRAAIRTRVQVFPLEQTNDALDDLRHGRIEGAAVLQTN